MRAVPLIMMLALTAASTYAQEGLAKLDKAPYYSLVYKLNVPGLLPGRTLVIGESGSQIPLRKFLICREGSNSYLIKSVAQLRGRFHIDSPAKALAFLRLFSNQLTWGLLDNEDSIEVVSKSNVSPAYCLDDKADVVHALTHEAGSGWNAVLLDAAAKNIGCSTTVLKKGSRFIVYRMLAEEGWPRSRNGFRLVQRVESVGPNGEYKLVSEVVLKIPTKGSNYDFYIPLEE